MEFSQWLQDEMDKRGWSQAELARRIQFTRGAIGNVLNDVRGPGIEMLNAIAKAFRLPPEYVFRKAGKMPERPDLNGERQQKIEQLAYLIDKMSPADQAEFIAMMEKLADVKLSRGREVET